MQSQPFSSAAEFFTTATKSSGKGSAPKVASTAPVRPGGAKPLPPRFDAALNGSVLRGVKRRGRKHPTASPQTAAGAGLEGLVRPSILKAADIMRDGGGWGSRERTAEVRQLWLGARPLLPGRLRNRRVLSQDTTLGRSIPVPVEGKPGNGGSGVVHHQSEPAESTPTTARTAPSVAVPLLNDDGAPAATPDSHRRSAPADRHQPRVTPNPQTEPTGRSAPRQTESAPQPQTPESASKATVKLGVPVEMIAGEPPPRRDVATTESGGKARRTTRKETRKSGKVKPVRDTAGAAPKMVKSRSGDAPEPAAATPSLEGRGTAPQVFRVASHPLPRQAPPPPTPLNPADLVSAVKFRLDGGARELTLRLKPEVLGRALVLLHDRDGELRLDFRVDNRDAARALEAQTPQLKEALLAAGFHAVTVDVHLQGDEAQSQAASDGRGGGSDDRGGAGDREESAAGREDRRDRPRMLGYNTFDLSA